MRSLLCCSRLRVLESVGIAALALTLGCSAMHDPTTTFSTSFTPPALMALDPPTVPVNSVPFIMTVTGNNFGRDAIVFWNTVPQSTRFVSPTQLQVAITADDLTQFGMARIYVQTGGQTSNSVQFNVTAQ
jgi:IPT/TIG domain-containing protein